MAYHDMLPTNRQHTATARRPWRCFPRRVLPCRWLAYRVLFATLLLAAITSRGRAAEPTHFAIQVIDDASGRGVPLMELETVNHLRFITDSNGLVAIAEPDLMGQRVFFTIRGHGYEFPADGFGIRGTALDVAAGGTATVKIKRINLAERLYRVTGGGIYRDSVLLGQPHPLEQPLLNARLIGCDSVLTAIFNGKIHWFWGDTSRLNHPLGGNFHTTGATSLLPADGGLDPAAGVRLEYFVNADGGARPMAEMAGDGPTWISGLTVLPGDDGQPRMFANYVKIRNQLESYRWGFVVWNDKTEHFDEVVSFDDKPKIFLEPQAHTFLHHDTDGQEYVYFCNPLPLTRVKADAKAFVDPSRYEAFQCLRANTRLEDRLLDRDANQRLQYSWKTGAPALTQQNQSMLVAEGLLEREEALIALCDVDTGRTVQAHSGSVSWNEYRQRWVLVTVEIQGETSLLGEVWFAEADQPTGPWVYARKVVTHDNYSFYNPKHHPFFDQDGGKTIFFEGTYTHTFSGNPLPTPRYDYNQVMYKLDLSIDALQLPVAWYARAADDLGPLFVTGPPQASGPRASGPLEIKPAFFAMPHPAAATVPMVWNGKSLQVQRDAATATVLFHALPADIKEPPATTAPLYEYVHSKTGVAAYSMDPVWSTREYKKTPAPICRVWKSPW